MIKRWETPRIAVEKFEANEYVAACWGVKCDVDWANDYEWREGDYRNGVTHDNAHCGSASNQVIFDDNNDGTADRMIETGTDGLGDLECILYTNGRYNELRDISSVKEGDRIYWTTQASDGRTWNHRGTVMGTTNRS